MLIAGETSGDIHGAGVVRELKKLNPSIEIFGIGGEKMQSEGMQLVYHVRELSFMGFLEVIKHLPLIRSVEKTLEQLLKHKKPDAVLLIDYPGFNLRFARKVKKYGIKVFYYISPQIWAWKKNRIKKIKTFVNKMFVVFPFEKNIYEKANVPVEFVGHPLLEEIQIEFSKEQFCKRYDIAPTKKILAVLPGSRKQEIEKLFSVMVRAANEIKKYEEIEIAVGVSPTISLEFYEKHLPPNIEVKFVEHATHEFMKYAHCAIVTSGTATLETALLETPMVIVYKTSLFTYLLAKNFLQIKNIGLANIVAEKTIVPELIQSQVTVENIANAFNNVIFSEEKYKKIKQELSVVKEKLGTRGASERVAKAIMETRV